MNDLERFDRIARERLSSRRYRHSVCVQRQAAWLARSLGADVQKAEIAGILHDICKEMPWGEQLQYLDAHGILLSDVERQAKPALHGLTASVWIERKFDYHDREVLDAIRWHTTGKSAMTLLEKIIYVADLTSEDRRFPDTTHIQRYLPHRIDDALVEMFCKVTDLLIRRKLPILPAGIEAYNYYIGKQREKRAMRRKQEENA